MSEWTYEGYWNAVLGNARSAHAVVEEFELDTDDERGVDEWLGLAESEAWIEVSDGGERPEEWLRFYAKALAELLSARVYAAVGTDGTRPVIWGIGRHEEEALSDAASHGGVEDESLYVHSISIARSRKVLSGDVAWHAHQSKPEP